MGRGRASAWGSTSAGSASPYPGHLVGRARRRRHVHRRDRDPAPPSTHAARTWCWAPTSTRAAGARCRGQRVGGRGGAGDRRGHRGAADPASGRAGRVRGRGAARAHGRRSPLRLPGVRRLARPGRTSRRPRDAVPRPGGRRQGGPRVAPPIRPSDRPAWRRAGRGATCGRAPPTPQVNRTSDHWAVRPGRDAGHPDRQHAVRRLPQRGRPAARRRAGPSSRRSGRLVLAWLR